MIVEWAVRKLFRIQKPQPAKRKTRDVKSAGDKREPMLNEPVAGAATAAPTALQPLPVQAGAAPGVPPLQAVREPVPQPEKAKPAEGDGKPPTILNFRAWFMADPVKSALLIGLSFLSWLATYTGMLELVEANAGRLDMLSRVAMGFSVVMLMLMILYLLDSLYSHATPRLLKPVFVAGYAFLTLISVGFGFGFYWKYLEAQTEATRSAESAVSQVQVSLQLGQTRLEQLQETFTQLAALSKSKADTEREHGNTCPNSRPGEGPRMRLRDEDSQKFGYAAEYITSRVGTVKTDLNALNGDLVKVSTRAAETVGADGTRNEFLRDLGRKLDMTIARFNALATDPQIKQFRESMDQRAGMTVFPSGAGNATFSCPDTQMQTALRGVVRAIDDIPEIKNPKIAAVEGSEAIVEAFRRLATTLAALPTLKLPPSPEELRKQRTAAISAGKANAEISNVEPGLSGRDYIPLSAAVFVDLCILLISLNRRNDQFEEFHRSVASAKTGHIGTTMLEIFDAHQNEVSQEMLEIFHQAEFEFGRDYYLAVPLIKGSKDAVYLAAMQAKETEVAEAKLEALDENIGIQEHELQRRLVDQTEAERMKKQIVDYLSNLGTHRSRLQQSQKQLTLAFQQQPQHQQALTQQMGGIEQGLARYNQQIGLLEKELDSANRLLHGTGELVRKTKQELSELKHKKTLLHEEEQNQLKKRIGVSSQLDLAKEARFLSNLCVSLEANKILKLAGPWPTQNQVRAKLLADNSRFYAPDRNYRIYRFRRVADTQSQMVLDLMMEAAKRARENGELVNRANKHRDKLVASGEAKAIEPTPEMLELERQKKELAEARAAMDAQMVTFRSELGALIGVMQQQTQMAAAAATAQATASVAAATGGGGGQPHPHIDHNAADAFYTDLGRKQRTKLAEAAARAKTEEVRERIRESIGAVPETPTLVDFAVRGEAIGSSMDEIGAQIRQQLEGRGVAATGAEVRRASPRNGIGLSNVLGKLGGLTARLRAGMEAGDDGLPIPAVPQPPAAAAPAAIEPRLAVPPAAAAPQVPAAPATPAAVVPEPPLVALREPMVAVRPEVAEVGADQRRYNVNFDSIPLPPRVAVVEPAPATQAGTVPEAEPVELVAEPEPVVVAPEPAHDAVAAMAEIRAQMQQHDAPAAPAEEPPAGALSQKQKLASINGRLQRMSSQIADHDRGHKAAVYQDAAAPAASAASDEAAIPAAVTAAAIAIETPAAARPRSAERPHAHLTDPVDVVHSVDLNQDEAGGAVPLVREIDDADEPSEADHFEEGALPAFLKPVGALDEASEELGTRAMAERLRPVTKGD